MYAYVVANVQDEDGDDVAFTNEEDAMDFQAQVISRDYMHPDDCFIYRIKIYETSTRFRPPS